MSMLSQVKAARARKASLADMKSRLALIKEEIGSAYNSFNAVSDPQLLESIVYEISALQSRYNCMLREVKTMQTQKDGSKPC